MSKALIFLVDDDLIYGETFKKILEVKKYENVQLYESAEDCIENLGKKPELIILDFSLNGINGLDAVKAIKGKQPKVKIVILTSLNPDKDLESKCYEAGVKGFFHKNEEGSGQLINWMDENINRGLFSFFG